MTRQLEISRSVVRTGSDPATPAKLPEQDTNALGQRTRKDLIDNGTVIATVVYHYDTQGQLIAETDVTGTTLREYIRVGDRPAAQVTYTLGTTSLVYLHTDHLQTVRSASDANGVIVWRWESDAFGVTAAEQDPDQDGNDTVVDLRFPGQLADAETGFFYNYHRTYDPSTGRYLESDPIGLSGGLDTYGYVSANPLKYSDPYGLIEWEGEFEIGAISGGVGAARVVFNLESECVAGKKVTIKDWVFWAFQTDIGLPFGAVRGNVRLEDGLSSLNPDNLNHQNLEGDFSATSIGPTVGPIGFPVGIDLGKASGLGWGKGLDFGVVSQATAGELKIPREKVRYEECECTQ